MMTNMKRYAWVWTVVALVAFTSAGWLQTAGAAEAAGVPVVQWSPHAVYKGRQIVMGPTGARGWVNGSTIGVTFVSKASPAFGVLQVHDTVIGVGGKVFKAGSDPRVPFGNAITEAETQAKGGKLSLRIIRDGKEQDAVVPIAVMGSYSPTWPYDCAKSSRILDEACAHLARAQYPDGHIPAEVGMATAWCGLLFLASDDAKYQDNARRAAYWIAARTWEKDSLNCWPSGYSGLLLAEYYLATGDKTVLPTLGELSSFLAETQMKCGSWGHNGPWGGYGAVNQVGLVCLMAMVLSNECGLEVDMAAMKRSLGFFERYADKGWVPYGDHRPYMGNNGNGKSALAAVVFDLVGGHAPAVRAFAGTVASSYAYREDGHTGPYFSFFWGPLAARRADDAAFRKFLDEQRWYYDLARTYDGGVVCQPNSENLSGRTPGSYTWSGPGYTTSGMALFYALPQKKLRILGAPRGPFAARVSAAVKQLRDNWVNRKVRPFADKLEEMQDAKLSDDDRRMVDTLAAVAARQSQSVKLTLASLIADAREGDVYSAAEKLKSLEQLIGKDAPEFADARKVIESDARWIESGKRYYEAWAAIKEVSDEYWHYYGKQAMAVMDGVEPIMTLPWQPLVPASEHVAQSWKTTQLAAGDNVPAGWASVGFDDAKWVEKNAPGGNPGGKVLLMRKALTLHDASFAKLRLRLIGGKGQTAKVYINGVLVVNATNGDAKRYSPIDLPDEARRLLTKGANVLAVTMQSEGNTKVDVALDAIVGR